MKRILNSRCSQSLGKSLCWTLLNTTKSPSYVHWECWFEMCHGTRLLGTSVFVCLFKFWPESPAPQITESSFRLTSRGVQRDNWRFSVWFQQFWRRHLWNTAIDIFMCFCTLSVNHPPSPYPFLHYFYCRPNIWEINTRFLNASATMRFYNLKTFSDKMEVVHDNTIT